MSMLFSILMLIAAQDAPVAAAQTAPAAQPGLFTHGIWKGQCWPGGLQKGEGGICRVAGGQAGKLWIMIERHPTGLDVYASGACGEDLPAVTVPQAQLTGAAREKAVRAAIDQAAAKANAACKTQEAFAGTDADLTAMLGETDVLAAGPAK
jgi:hypothetical protein